MDNNTNRQPSSLRALALAALGVVYGDIGTSPLYAFKEAFAGAHPLALSEANVLAVLSMMFWSIALIVSLKYVGFVLRFDNGGEGGILALLARASRVTRDRPRLAAAVAVVGIFGASLFYGDAIITPAISVVSAVEGVSVATPAFEHWVVPVTIAILVALFAIQSRGTGSVGKLFGPVIVVWFLVIAGLGAQSIAQTPSVIAALDPRHALRFAWQFPGLTFVVMGAVFLAITGAEALYADMGHFGRAPIRLAWFALVFPALMINYFGQGALALREPAAMKNPFYLLAPQEWTLPLVLLVLEFKSSTALAAAYGIAVSGTMLLTTVLVGVVAWFARARLRVAFLALLAAIGLVELMFFAANSLKFADGGWFPLACGLAIFVALTTWKRAETVLAAHESRRRLPLAELAKLAGPEIPRVPGTAVYLSPDPESLPAVLLHNLKHNKVLHERIVLLTLVDSDEPRVPDRERTEVTVMEIGRAYRVKLYFGFMEEPDVPKGLKLLARHGLRFEPMDTTFFLGKTALARAAKPGLFTWRRELFRWMQRNSPATAEYFKLMPERVVELGTRVVL